MHDAFVSAVTADPDDLVSRLVYADWLLEQEDPAEQERGEFIHLQMANSRPEPDAEFLRARLARQTELLQRHRATWAAGIQDYVSGYEFRRGFIERVTLSGEQFALGFHELVGLVPVIRVCVKALTMSLEEVVKNPALHRVRELDLSGQVISATTLQRLLEGDLRSLRSLDLGRTMLDDSELSILLRSRVFPQLRFLGLATNQLTRRGVDQLLGTLCSQGAYVALEQVRLQGILPNPNLIFPPGFARLPMRLRHALEHQLRGAMQKETHRIPPLTREQARELDRVAASLTVAKATFFPEAVRGCMVPAEVMAAFRAVCTRRLQWRLPQLAAGIPVSPKQGKMPELDQRKVSLWQKLVARVSRVSKEKQADSIPPTVLPTVSGAIGVTELLEAAVKCGGEEAAHREVDWLRDCLLDLYARHFCGIMAADGKTR